LFICLVFLESFVGDPTGLFWFFCIRRLSCDVLHGRFRPEHMYRHWFCVYSLPCDVLRERSQLTRVCRYWSLWNASVCSNVSMTAGWGVLNSPSHRFMNT
jgi:hypothetical protein